MKVLIFGGDGMLGHQLVRTLGREFEVAATIRDDVPVEAARDLLPLESTYTGIDVRDTHKWMAVVDAFQPTVAVNAVGIVKQRSSAAEAIPSIQINSLFPHQLQRQVEACGGRAIHVSTDCVFSGRKGRYKETDPTDAEDLYGRSKLLGEVTGPKALTLRTSMIGRELKRRKSLLEWFLSQHGRVGGYHRAIFSGLTTLEVARVIRSLIADHPEACGLYHLAGPAISKHDLLCRIRDCTGRPVEIVPDGTIVVDRSLDAALFNRTFDYSPPSWETMITEIL